MTAVKAMLLERAARRGLITEARERKAELQTAVDDAVRALTRLLEAGISRDYLSDTARGLHDAASNADQARNVTIDECGEWYDGIDLDELSELIAQIDAPAASPMLKERV